MKKKEYEIPRMDKLEVELEKGFMKASVFVDKEDSESLPIENQKRGEEFNFGEGFGDNTWD
ncbi:MAG: hypothetical protein MSK40_08630 [Parabacteroides sp.]|nr:hypothetical protein [Parabacteroides sp.]